LAECQLPKLNVAGSNPVSRSTHLNLPQVSVNMGPAAGAVFIGHALNGVAPRIHLFEEQFGAYSPSITL
jgi:hypothetical protein